MARQLLKEYNDSVPNESNFKRPISYIHEFPEDTVDHQTQASIASFFVNAVSTLTKKRFLIYTYSDYIIDRFRIEIMDGKLKHTDFSLIVTKDENIAYRILFDKQANMINKPSWYREFENKEADRLLGLAGSHKLNAC